MAVVAIVVLALIALAGWALAWKALSFGVKVMGERDAALERFGQLSDEDGTFVRVHVESLRSLVEWAGSDASEAVPYDDLDYFEERLRTVKS